MVDNTPDSLNPSNSFLGAIRDAIAEQSQYADDHSITWDRFGSLSAYVCSFYGFSTMFLAFILNRTAIFATARSSNWPGLRLARSRSANSRSQWLFTITTTFLRLSAAAALLYAMKNVLVTLKIIKDNAQDPDSLPLLIRLIPSDWLQYDPAKYATDRYMIYRGVRLGDLRKTPKVGRAITILELSVSLQEVSSGLSFLRKYNTAKRPTEQVLMVCMFSLADHLLFHFGTLLYGRRYRLIPSSIISIMFLSYHLRCLRNGSWINFPAVIISAYTSLLFLWAVIISCALIFLLAIIAKGSKYEELQFASYFSTSEEGNESSYITEYNYVTGSQSTWIEQSLADKLSSIFGAGSLSRDADSVKSGKILAYLKANRMSGYGNLVDRPPLRLISMARDEKFNFKLQGAWKQRYHYFRESIVRLYQLVTALISSLTFQLIPNLFRKYILRRPVSLWGSDHETEEEYRQRQSRAPKFVQHFIKKREPKQSSGSKFNINDLQDDDIAAQYSTLLQSVEFNEEDESPDYVIEDHESEYETDSEAESIDLTHGQIIPGRTPLQATAVTSALGELMTAENLLEMLQEDPDLLTQHLNYDSAKEGIMTRSRYRARNRKGFHEAEELLDLLLTKRAREERKTPDQAKMAATTTTKTC
ncbi:hypothetical protein CJJ09_004459 [Candidozyma auris]|nr:hypothetical protein CJJ09_004459 [[Candida] auris]